VASRSAANGNNGRNGGRAKPPARKRKNGTKAIVLAGGRGTRLAPYTSVLPKPLMPVGERAILELVVDQLETCGITDITFSVGYLSHLIQSVFDNRDNGAVSIEYVHEAEALGTAAPLKLVDDLDSTFLVMNGDVLTELDYRDLISYHQEHGNMLTIATRKRAIKVDYGILHLDVSQRVRDFEEKPEMTSSVSMGVYVMEPEVLDYIPDNQYFDFPHLVEALLEARQPIGAYRYSGLWFDIGRQEDYEQAVTAWIESQQGKSGFAPERDSVGDDGSAALLDGALERLAVTKARAKQNGNGDAARDAVDLDSFKETLAGVPAPVTIVTTSAGSKPHGTTVSAFSSLSADPPLVLVALDTKSDQLRLQPETGRFAVNLLAGDQEELGLACAKKGPDKFAKVPWQEDLGLPRIEGAAAFLACEIQEFLPGGDHVIVVGLVTACESEKDEALVYHRRRFLQLA
jgi:NDP-sugar pyrophosphorylase family protein/flavin reductase (DIM6/NTAB) family NADH-FMN oxidoreductase RutF